MDRVMFSDKVWNVGQQTRGLKFDLMPRLTFTSAPSIHPHLDIPVSLLLPAIRRTGAGGWREHPRSKDAPTERRTMGRNQLRRCGSRDPPRAAQQAPLPSGSEKVGQGVGPSGGTPRLTPAPRTTRPSSDVLGAHRAGAPEIETGRPHQPPCAPTRGGLSVQPSAWSMSSS